MKLKRDIVLLAVAIAVVTIAAFGPGVSGGFVSDDTQNVRDNPLLRSLDWGHLKAIFSSFDDANYIPVKVLSLAVDYSLWGPAPTGFHVTNILLHVLCALLVFAILIRLEIPAVPACLAALIWAVHPLQVESVAWISERKNVLSGLFFLAAFLLYLSYSDTGRARTYVAIVALFVLATLSKMNTMVLPALCLAYEMTFRFRLRRRDLQAALPLLGIGAMVGWYNLSGNPIHGSSYHGGSSIVTWLSSSVVIFRYLGNTVLPVRLCTSYDVPLRDSLLDPPVLLSAMGLLILGSVAFWCWRSKRREGFWILWFGITLVPMLNIIPFPSLMNDRYMYLALVAPIGLAASLMGRLTLRPQPGRAAVIAAALAGAICAGLSFARVGVFASDFSLWKDWALRNPYIASDPRFIQADFNAKVDFLRAAVNSNSPSAAAYNNLGALYFEAGQHREAIPLLESAVRLDPECGPMLLNLGRACARSGDLIKARPILESAVRAAPYDFTGHLSLARVYLQTGDVLRARRELEACGRIRPSPADAVSWEPERRYLSHLENGATQPAPARNP